MSNSDKKADICLVLEGTYPYVPGGVSTWTHELIKAQSHLTFHIIALLPPNAKAKIRYKIPKNVLSIKKVFLQKLKDGESNIKIGNDTIFKKLKCPYSACKLTLT